jgi:hypothetical protein
VGNQKKPMKFSDLNFEPHTNYPDSGIAARYFFPNGYGVSVVRFTSPGGFGGSYGAEQGLYELAILKGLEENWDICYDTPITDDVLGHLSEEEVEVLLYEVENL